MSTINNLPTEILRQILRFATRVPFLLNLDWDYAPEDHLWEGWESIDVNDTAIQTKRAIVQVCRTWKELGVEFLYETIQVYDPSADKPDRVRELVKVLRQSSASASNQGYG